MMHIQHNTEQQYFYITLPKGREAVVKYRFQGDDRVDFYSTYVPDLYRGNGYANALIDQALIWAREKGLEIHTSCWYARKFLDQSQKVA